jgi:hypothetical protein
MELNRNLRTPNESNLVRVIETNLTCGGCKSKVRKYIDRTPEEMLGKTLCKCVDNKGELTGPRFPLFET